MNDKIRPTHLERSAVVYVRQSSAGQVQRHRESQRLQYGLADRAHALGFHQVVVIDEDLGRSGSGSQERPGFAKLVTAVCAGEVGAVVAFEASRLARNNRDWHHLIDLCAVTETLVVDQDGIYEPRQLNDRLLLGLKGTMSEFELGLFRQRARQAFLSMVRRGVVLTEVPAGYVRTEDNRCEITPDRQVQAAVRGLFVKFGELGSARQLVRWYHQENLLVPRNRPGSRGAEIEWCVAKHDYVTRILQNPMYAGAFVYGRSRQRTAVIDGRTRRGSPYRLPREQWTTLIHDHHPAYISWAEYERHQEILARNAGRFATMTGGAARSGRALLAGLLRCGRCGRRMYVVYGAKPSHAPIYQCRGDWGRAGGVCLAVGGLRIEETIVHRLLEALAPVAIEASLAAHDEWIRREDETRKQLRLALERARYETERARRQYDLVDPGNRLVAAELEERWNQALEHVRQLEARLESGAPAAQSPSDDERTQLLELGRDLERAWHSPAASAVIKKRILRTAIHEIIVDGAPGNPTIRLRIHWAGGVHTSEALERNLPGKHSRCTDQTAIEVVRDASLVCDDATIASILNNLGLRSGAGNTWTESRVRALRSNHRIPKAEHGPQSEFVSAHEAARLLDVGITTVRRYLEERILPGRQVVPRAPWIIRRTDLSLPVVAAAVRASHSHPSRSVPPLAAEQLPLISDV